MFPGLVKQTKDVPVAMPQNRFSTHLSVKLSCQVTGKKYLDIWIGYGLGIRLPLGNEPHLTSGPLLQNSQGKRPPL